MKLADPMYWHTWENAEELTSGKFPIDDLEWWKKLRNFLYTGYLRHEGCDDKLNAGEVALVQQIDTKMEEISAFLRMTGTSAQHALYLE